MEWEHPHGKHLEHRCVAIDYSGKGWRNLAQSNLGGNNEDWFTRRNFQRQIFSVLYTHRKGPSQGERKYLGSFTDCTIELGYSKQTPWWKCKEQKRHISKGSQQGFLFVCMWNSTGTKRKWESILAGIILFQILILLSLKRNLEGFW